MLDVGETGTISFDVSNAGSEFLSTVRAQAVVTSNHDVTIENDGLNSVIWICLRPSLAQN